jgi:molybdopterin/thiamine biosynthesis adenylyltransferase
VLCIGAGGIVSQIAPTLARKGVGAITLLDDDVVEASNLNRQRFYERDFGKSKAIALARNLQPECIATTEICGYAFRLEEAVERGVDLACDAAVCGVDNNPARTFASRHFRSAGIPVVFTAVSTSGDHGYVFVQERNGPCLACLFPDMVNDDRYPCPGTPGLLTSSKRSVHWPFTPLTRCSCHVHGPGTTAGSVFRTVNRTAHL